MHRIALATAMLLLLPVASASAQDVANCPRTFDARADSSASTLTCRCVTREAPGIVYGSFTYTSDSHLCAAARHAGAPADGSPVVFRAAEGCRGYYGSERNGIASRNWGRWSRSVYLPAFSDGGCVADEAAFQAAVTASAPGGDPPRQATANDSGAEAETERTDDGAANGLKALETLVGAWPPGTVTYGAAQPRGPSGLVVEDIKIDLDRAGPMAPITIEQALVEEVRPLDLSSGPPERLLMTLTGISLTQANSGVEAIVFEIAGSAAVTLNLQIDYTWNGQAGAFAIRRAALDAPGLGALLLSFDLGGLYYRAAMERPDRLPELVAVRGLEVSFEDGGLVGRLIDAVAAAERSESEAVKGLIVRETLAFFDEDMAGQPRLLPLFALLRHAGGLLRDAETPGGTLGAAVQIERALSLEALEREGDLEALLESVQLRSSYSGLPLPLVGHGERDFAGLGLDSLADLTARISVATDKRLYEYGEPVEVTFSGLAKGRANWITLVPVMTSATDWRQWHSVGSGGRIRVAGGLLPGVYEVRVHENWPDGGFTIRASSLFAVGEGFVPRDAFDE